MLTTLMLAAALSLHPGSLPKAEAAVAQTETRAKAAPLVLVRGGPDRVDPFAELREKRRQEAERKKKKAASDKK